MIRVGIVAGEVSGDQLGADLIDSLRRLDPDLTVEGIGGEKLENVGCKILFPMEKLAVMGISEVFTRLFEILSIRRKIIKHFLKNPPDLFVGVDAPDFNFPLERRLRKSGIKTVHYVSPSIWAWREYRLSSIEKCVDLMLTLYPFELPYYRDHGIPAVFVGHPLARQIPLTTDKTAARERLGLPHDKKIVAMFPGSRQSELERLTEPFLESLALCQAEYNSLCFITNLTNDNACRIVKEIQSSLFPELDIRFFTNQSLDVMEAADIILLASGTATLEAMLLKRPMVVGYKVNWLTYQIAKRLIRTPYVSLPNIIAGRKIVPEYLQHECTPENIASELLFWIKNEDHIKEQKDIFTNLHLQISANSDELIASSISAMLPAMASSHG